MSFLQRVLYFIEEYGASFWQGVQISAFLAAAGTALGCVIGFAAGAVSALSAEPEDSLPRRVLLRAVRTVVAVYVWLFRGTPMMVQAMVVFYGSSYFGADLDPIACGLCIVAVNTGAYMTETVRGGIQSLDPGQSEGAAAIGMTRGQAMRLVLLPQAFRGAVPQIGNYLISNVKDTSVLSVITVGELFYVGRALAGQYFLFFEVFTVVCLIYLVLTSVTTALVHLAEKWLAGPKDYDLAPAAQEAA